MIAFVWMWVLAAAYASAFPRCIVVVCETDARNNICAWTYDGADLKDWEADLMTGVAAFETESLKHVPYVNQFRCEAR